jgi:hypothetical protein
MTPSVFVALFDMLESDSESAVIGEVADPPSFSLAVQQINPDIIGLDLSPAPDMKTSFKTEARKSKGQTSDYYRSR